MGATKHATNRAAFRRPTPTQAALATAAQPATFTARLIALDERGQAWVIPDDDADESASPQPARQTPHSARSTLHLSPEHVGRQVLACRANRRGQWVIVGLLTDLSNGSSAEASALDLVVERRRIVLSAQTEVVLQCGDGSITLAADGKVTIRGVDVVSSATRTQRIRGGAVRIN